MNSNKYFQIFFIIIFFNIFIKVQKAVQKGGGGWLIKNAAHTRTREKEI